MLTLTSGVSSVVVAPEFGAGVTGWMRGRTPMLRRALPQASAAGDSHAMGCFPLLPYCNRMGLGQFTWLGKSYRLTPNFGDHPHTIHGVGWQRAWDVQDVAPNCARMTLDHHPDDSWPFAFQAHVEYSLTQTALTVGIQITNRHDTPAPAGIGLHPYFPKAHAPTLRFDATGAWQNGADALPSQHGDVPPDWMHRDSRPISESRLDNCFTGWPGSAGITAGPASLRIEATEAFRQLQVFTPDWADFFCVEPVSHVPDALNRPELPLDQAMNVLEPGQALRGTITLTPTGLSAS